MTPACIIRSMPNWRLVSLRRAKNGPSAHLLRDDEPRVWRELCCQFADSTFVFGNERGGPFTADAVNPRFKR